MNIQARVFNKVKELNEYQNRYYFQIVPAGKANALEITKVNLYGDEIMKEQLVKKSMNWVALEGFLKGILAVMPYFNV